MIYLDNSATTQLDADVFEAMLPWLRSEYGNASSVHGLGRRARVAIEDARTIVASALNAHPAEITFTSGGTESNNTVLHSCLIESGLAKEVAVSATEHHSVLTTAESLGGCGIPFHVLETDEFGRVPESILRGFNRSEVLVSVMHVNNETGVVQPIDQLRSHVPNALLHSDVVQSFGKLPIDATASGVDFLSISAHKIHGPKGIGAMFIRKGINFLGIMKGGGQERNRRAGTEAVAQIVGFAKATELAIAAMENRVRHMQELTALARTLILESIPDVRINTPLEGAAPHILNVSFLDASRLDGEAILQLMDMQQVAVSNGSACVSGSVQPSHVLLAMNLPPAEARAAVRFSVSTYTTNEEIRRGVAILTEVIRRLRV